MNEPLHFDLVAIGGSFAGLCAAVRGAELGLRTAVLETGADEDYLCSSRWAGGILHVSYHDVKLSPLDIGADAVVIADGGFPGNAALFRQPAGDAAARALDPPPFFAIPICAGITNTMGGIAIDGHGRAKRPDGSATAGLYAAGGTTGGLEGGGALGYVGGLVKACVLGLRVAEHAAGRHG